MTHLRMSMSKKEKEDLNEFISFLLKTYGIPENVIWKELRQISQRTEVFHKNDLIINLI